MFTSLDLFPQWSRFLVFTCLYNQRRLPLGVGGENAGLRYLGMSSLLKPGGHRLVLTVHVCHRRLGLAAGTSASPGCALKVEEVKGRTALELHCY